MTHVRTALLALSALIVAGCSLHLHPRDLDPVQEEMSRQRASIKAVEAKVATLEQIADSALESRRSIVEAVRVLQGAINRVEPDCPEGASWDEKMRGCRNRESGHLVSPDRE